MTKISAVRRRFSPRAVTAFAFATALLAAPFGTAKAQMLGYAPMQPQVYPRDPSYSQGYLNVEPQAAGEDAQLPDRLHKQIVSFDRSEPAGTIVIDTGNTYLYYVLGNGRAIRYGVGVGREGFTWSGVKSVERKAEWPDWTPPPEMIARAPYLPRFMAGGVTNPLGARAMYLSGSFYRIHGTNAPSTIGSRASSGCIRMANDDVIDLYERVKVGTKVIVLPAADRHAAAGFGADR
jgi:lipoprotein-anchoring transpeptidase ErfK/SrfK